MPFQSEKQRRYLWANEPEIARDWTDTYGSRIEKNDGGILDSKYAIENRRRYFSGEYGQGAGDRGGDPHASAAQNIAAGHVTGDEADRVKKKHNITKKDLRIAKKENKARAKDIKDTRKSKAVQKKKLQRMIEWAKKNKHIMDKPGWGTVEDQVKSFQEAYNRGLIQGVPGYDEFAGPYTGEDSHDYRQEYADLMGLQDKKTAGPNKGKYLGTKYLDRTPDFQTLGSLPAGLRALGFGKPNFNTAISTFNRINKLGDITTRGDWNEYWDDVRKRHIIPGGEGGHGGGGYMGYPSYEAWLAAQGRGTGEVAEVVEEETPSAFQQSLTTGANTPNYYVGETPLASNIAWGKQMGVDPRTMGLTSWAAEGGRIPAAYGGIMDTATGRRAYGLGSIFKKIGRAAKKVLKSDVGKAALIAGAGWAANTWGPTAGWFSNMAPWQKGILLASSLPFFMKQPEDDEGDKGANYDLLRDKYASELMNIKRGVSAGSLNPEQWSYLPQNYTYTGAEGGRIGYDNGGEAGMVEDTLNKINQRALATARAAKEAGITLTEAQEQLIKQAEEQGLAYGGRSGFYAGGQSTPSDYTMEDARMTTTQDKLGGITEAMKRADLYRQGSVGQMYAADGGRIGYGSGTAHPDPNRVVPEGDLKDNILSIFSNKLAGREYVQPLLGGQTRQGGRGIGNLIPNQGGTHFTSLQSPDYKLQQAFAIYQARGGDLEFNEWKSRQQAAQGGRIGAEEGGLMDLGGMEKDYRNDGGFVPIGGKEKADDVPARLSRNEFVFTADAVRGAGGGDIDKGAEIMENIMKNLEQGGQISEETQGLTGAREMFGVSERLSEVV